MYNNKIIIETVVSYRPKPNLIILIVYIVKKHLKVVFCIEDTVAPNSPSEAPHLELQVSRSSPSKVGKYCWAYRIMTDVIQWVML